VAQGIGPEFKPQYHKKKKKKGTHLWWEREQSFSDMLSPAATHTGKAATTIAKAAPATEGTMVVCWTLSSEDKVWA
jgi:hypothetical protein